MSVHFTSYSLNYFCESNPNFRGWCNIEKSSIENRKMITTTDTLCTYRYPRAACARLSKLTVPFTNTFTKVMLPHNGSWNILPGKVSIKV